uniref:GH16 domain-containing protein n=1 Tax=Pyrodinium bahamense TaxID=73915 RepID=A0A7S0A8Q0_9DINO|mmetsp:Transcript_25999/g.71535  ORF Transcript_25999/g.71535 Transcript_25999/m.71535 type:complete len:464 (+) Transcript_25999:70-1461(+)
MSHLTVLLLKSAVFAIAVSCDGKANHCPALGPNGDGDDHGLLQLVARSDPSCAAYHACSNLSGNCCPDSTGLMLSCCSASSGPSDVQPVVIIDSVACAANPACSHLSGDCCPPSTGEMLACCESLAAAPASSQSKPSPSTSAPPQQAGCRGNSSCKATPAVNATPHRANPDSALQLECAGKKFLDCWTFFTESDPTSGYVTYVSKDEAIEYGLYSVEDSGAVRLGSLVGTNERAKSIRVQSKETFQVGHIFVIDIAHMPTGQGTWPAWWSYGPSWPENGEIDTIETVETETWVHTTLHTSAGCSMSSVSGVFHSDCNAGDANDGCGVDGPAGSGGSSFNSAGGGVYATRWTESSIDVWLFKRAEIPQDLTTNEPDPDAWGAPYVSFPFGESCPASHFNDTVLVINLDFCGNWAGNVFPGGNGACESYVGDPANKGSLADAFWEINSVKVFSASAPSPQPASWA